MSVEAWTDGRTPPDLSVGPLGWLLVVPRAVLIALAFLIGVALTLLLRPVEWLISREVRRITPLITQATVRATLRIVGLRWRVRGTPMKGAGAVVANHGSWLDILVLNAPKRVYFVAKSEVAGWPVIGWLARLVDTAFIRRDRREARAQVELFRHRLSLGHRLLFFPEGTSTDGLRVLPFKTTLFAAFFTPGLRESMQVQPVTLVYHGPPGRDARFYGWWGDMELGEHLLAVLATPRQGRVEIVYHPPVMVRDFADRKSLAAHLETMVRGPLLDAIETV